MVGNYSKSKGFTQISCVEIRWHPSSKGLWRRTGCPGGEKQNQNLKQKQLMTKTTEARAINGNNTEALQGAIGAITQEPSKSMTRLALKPRLVVN